MIKADNPKALLDELQNKREEKAFDDMMDAVIDLLDTLEMKAEEDEEYEFSDEEVNFMEAVNIFLETIDEEDKNNN